MTRVGERKMEKREEVERVERLMKMGVVVELMKAADRHCRHHRWSLRKN
jgi:hypothetical protein